MKLLFVRSEPIHISYFQARHFLDFTPDGSLCHILAAMYKCKFDQGWRRFDLNSPSKKDANLDMCTKAEEALIEKNKIRYIYKKKHFATP